MIRRARYRAAYLLTLASILFVAIEIRLFQLQVVQARDPVELAAYRSHVEDLQGCRGMILDTRGGVLARTTTAVNVFYWSEDHQAGRTTGSMQVLADMLEQILGVDARDTARKLAEKPWALLAEDVSDPELIAELHGLSRRFKYRGLHLEEIYHRVYPQGSLFAPFLGFVDHEGIGRSGVERTFDLDLQAIPGSREVLRDARQRVMLGPNLDRDPVEAGRTIHLTLDPVLQLEAERVLERTMEERQATSCMAVVLRPATGEILAMAQRPAPPPGRPLNPGEVSRHRSLLLEDVYAPGSTLKPFLLALALERGTVDMATPLDCEDGLSVFGIRRVTDVDGGYGMLTPADILVNSSNVGMAKIVLQMVPPDIKTGDPRFQFVLDYLRDFGFGEPVLKMPGEAPGLLTRLSKFSKNYTLVSLSYGYEIGVTAAQMATAAAALINGGTWIRPRVWSAVETASGDRIQPTAESRVVIQPETSALIRGLLQRVVEEGGTSKLRPAGYSMGGKTGTAEKEQDPSKISPSFFCFGPVPDPQLLVLVQVDEPQSGRFASQIAAPPAAELYGKALHLLNIQPDRPEELQTEAEVHRGGSR